MLLLGHIILKETPIYLVICLVTYNFNRWGFSVQPILRVFNTLKHIHTNTSTHLSATKIKMTLFLYVSRLYKKEIIKRYKYNNIYFYSSNIKEDDIKMKTAKTFLNKLYGGDMKSLVLNFAKNEELNNKEIEELRDILNDISKK
ncbi:BlaI/MecI/CopY family transcriptional regulator [Staphylococcus aureus]|uniref:BlaI/MecI/CopY family transcriptional regulator n=1 Tax=Staphylococcus aureus TaxID=1280 RepID=UPI003F59F088